MGQQSFVVQVPVLTDLKEVKLLLRDSGGYKKYMVQLVDLLTCCRHFDHAYEEHHIVLVDTLLFQDTDMKTLSIHHALSSSRHTQILPAGPHDTNPVEQVQLDTPFYTSAYRSQQDSSAVVSAAIST
jgi:hypothetical protein